MLPSNWIYTSEEDEVTEIISEVKRLPIVDVLSSYGVVPEKTSGHNTLALCPFYMDNTIGSFVINTVTNTGPHWSALPLKLVGPTIKQKNKFFQNRLT